MIEILSTVGLCVLLGAVILYDLRQMRLPNRLALLFVLLFALAEVWTVPAGELAGRVGVALLVLVLGMVANAARLVGGGDVKILSALMLFIPLRDLAPFLFLLSLSMAGGIAVLLVVRRALRGVDTGWIGLQESGRYPMGISIGAAGLVYVALNWSGAL
ncbi:prepilin peptidase [Thalassorhabdomicrobium marinisediminis]|uniref:prepilin peptidase n=1 Tax=Thalassorhabdomicrobium marinisediminis TaxID=2170577 RepID=UPI0024904728|nr:prepilin peptidase [Thalassorhabdomicrobium marinisediminis]